MCWNAPVSAIFGVLGLACAGFLYYVGRKAQASPDGLAFGRWTADSKWHALWVGNIACVELCELIIWLNVLPFWDLSECPVWNKVGTFGVFTFGFANWSWVIGVWCNATCAGDERRRYSFSVWKWFAIVTSAFWFIAIFVGESFEVGVEYMASAAGRRANLTRPIYRVYDDLSPSSQHHSPLVGLEGVPIKTCSYQEEGLYPHLHWRFAYPHVPWMPSMGWTFFATMFLPFFFYRPLSRSVVILTWGATTYIGPYAILPVEETMSVFWWLGFGFEILFIAEPFYTPALTRLLERCCAQLAAEGASPPPVGRAKSHRLSHREQPATDGIAIADQEGMI